MSSRVASVLLWLVAFVLTVFLAVFQRATGPSYPVRGSVEVGVGRSLDYRLLRSHAGGGGLSVSIPAPGHGGRATLEWRRFPTEEAFQRVEMREAANGRLEAEITHQPPAGKVEYRVFIESAENTVSIPPEEAVVARFRGDVPAGVLIPHILCMFLSMLVSTRALLEVMRPGAPSARTMVLTSMGLLIAGGLVLGPIVQKYAFGAFWTGWPFGTDLTDNKTLFAFLAWLPATVAAARSMRTRVAVVLGWIVMMGVFLIPHSARGSELDWSQTDATPADDAATRRPQ